MSARLSTAIRIGEAARAILRKTRSFPDQHLGEIEDWADREHIGVEPMLLALSMELALKAWFVFDHDDPNVPKSHDLTKLFDALLPESQQKLDQEFRRSVNPLSPSPFFVDYGIRDILTQHKDAFVDWRYLHEAKKTMMFDQSAFEATLGECPELCVSGPVHAVSDTQASKRSPNIMANWLRAANHSLTFRPSFSKLRMAR